MDAVAVDPTATAWVADSVALLKRHDEGQITADEYESAVREIQARRAAGNANDGGPWGYVLLLIGAFVAYAAVADGRPPRDHGSGRSAEPPAFLARLSLPPALAPVPSTRAGRGVPPHHEWRIKPLSIPPATRAYSAERQGGREPGAQQRGVLSRSPSDALCQWRDRPVRSEATTVRAVGSRFVLAVLISISPIAAVPVLAGDGPTSGYIVVLRDGPASPDAAETAKKHAAAFGVSPTHVYSHALHGYAAQMSPAVASAMASDPRVLFVAPDSPVFALNRPTGTQILPTGIDRIDADRSSTRSGDGRGSVDVNVAVLDTGIDLKHPDLNVVGGVACRGKSFQDGAGHGTHVAGTIGAIDNASGVVGVAPGARLWAVKVLGDNGVGTNSTLICGIDWVTSTRSDADPTNDIAVGNMSLSGPGTDDGNCGLSNKDPLHLAICNSVAAGITYAAAAGNSGSDLARGTPASYDEVLAVTAMADFDGRAGGAGGQTCLTQYPQADDAAAFFSNFAGSADQAHTVSAPGFCILSTVPGDLFPGGLLTESGTSMASPHAAGTIALCIASGACAALTPAQIIQKIRADAAAYSTSTPGYGFIGDPLRPEAGKYYGYLIRAAAY